MQELPGTHLTPHSLVEPFVVQGLTDILKPHPVGRKDIVDELGVLKVWSVGLQISQYFS